MASVASNNDTLFETAPDSVGDNPVVVAQQISDAEKMSSSDDVENAIPIDFSSRGNNDITMETDMDMQEQLLEDTGSLRVISVDESLIDCLDELVEGRLELTNARLVIQSLVKDSETYVAELAMKQRELDDAQSDVASLSKDLAATNERVSAERRDTEAQLESLRCELEECKSKFEESRSYLQSAIEVREVELVTSKSEIASLSRDCEALRADLRQKQSEADEARSEVIRLTTGQAERNETIQAERRASDARVEILSKELEECRTNSTEAESNLRDSMLQLSKQLQECSDGKNTAERDLSEALAKLKVVEDQKSSAEALLASLSKDSQECRSQLKETETKLNDADTKATSLSEEMQGLQNSILRIVPASSHDVAAATHDIPTSIIGRESVGTFTGRWYANTTQYLRYTYAVPLHSYTAPPRRFGGGMAFWYSIDGALDTLSWKRVAGAYAGVGVIEDIVYYTGRAHSFKENRFNTEVYLPASPQQLVKIGLKVLSDPETVPEAGLIVLLGVGVVFGFRVKIHWRTGFSVACSSNL